ncbi:MAG TPA: Hsp20/alpha crystallin family protein [Cyclobacteriaceae bacterium]|nr:Hsp20/alpha crystallin family protein [Cyclobacteriaceae bacterium]HNP06040.1 Hsp20/alpha crystallin family protein [Cyclobacteriaceae bacterium]HRK54384.1 Hsp20/alpha crystallin family protein [Cyclobacteriaceae bacterium]
MSIIRYNPNDFAPTSFSNLIDKFFNDSMQRSGQGTFVPKVDVVETEKAFELFVEVPGMNKEDFNLEVNDNYLTISGERKFSSEKNEKNFHSIETRYGSFSRSFTLPDSVSSDKINAKYNNGILELTIPKDEKKLLKSTIKVN